MRTAIPAKPGEFLNAQSIASILPNLENLNYRAQAVHALPIDGVAAAMAVLHALLYIIILLAIAVLAFRRKVL